MQALTRFAGHKRLLLVLFSFAMMLFGATLVGAQDLIQPDGRINQVAHFGGDAFYCVDDNFVATTNYPEMIAGGGFRLLNSNGQELWFVPAADILAAIEESVETKAGVLVAEGQGTYGPVRLYTYFDGKDQQFVFSGYDEFGKPNSLTFIPCTPVGPVPEPAGEGEAEELCTLIIIPPNGTDKLIAPVKGFQNGQKIPCELCPGFGGGAKFLPGKRSGEVALVAAFCLELVN